MKMYIGKVLVIFFCTCVLLSMVQPSDADGFTLFPIETLQKKLLQITDRILSWSPFGSGKKQQIDELELDLNDDGNGNASIRRHYFYGCSCKNFACSCCAHVEVPKTSLNHTGCLNMTYENINSMAISFDLNEQIYYNRTVAIVKPPNMCAQFNTLNLTQLCLKFYKLDARNGSFSGSVDLIVKLTDDDNFENSTELSHIKLGSFRFGNGTSFYEKNLMKIYLNRKNLNTGGSAFVQNKTSTNGNLSSLDQFYESYDSFINKLNYFPLPKFSFNFQPDRLVDNLYQSLFSSRMLKKLSPNFNNNDTLSSNALPTPSIESREADFQQKRGYYRVQQNYNLDDDLEHS